MEKNHQEHVEQEVKKCLHALLNTAMDPLDKREAERRAIKAESCRHMLFDYIKFQEDSLIDMRTLLNAQAFKIMSSSTGKNAQVRELEIKANELYSSTREHIERLENRIKWSVSMHKSLENIHLLFRQKAKDIT
jgi:hypothetical protein